MPAPSNPLDLLLEARRRCNAPNPTLARGEPGAA
jgi:hypothetical protein